MTLFVHERIWKVFCSFPTFKPWIIGFTSIYVCKIICKCVGCCTNKVSQFNQDVFLFRVKSSGLHSVASHECLKCIIPLAIKLEHGSQPRKYLYISCDTFQKTPDYLTQFSHKTILDGWDTFKKVSPYVTPNTWIPWNLSFPYIHCTAKFTAKMKANAEPHLVFIYWCEFTLPVWCHSIVWTLFFMKWKVTQWQFSWNSWIHSQTPQEQKILVQAWMKQVQISFMILKVW